MKLISSCRRLVATPTERSASTIPRWPSPASAPSANSLSSASGTRSAGYVKPATVGPEIAGWAGVSAQALHKKHASALKVPGSTSE
jgi:hypothetical protein